MAAFFTCCLTSLAQQPEYPKEIRGYKVVRAEVEAKKAGTKATNEEPDSESLIRFGNPENARMTSKGITFELPMVVAEVKRKGRVDFMVFEEMLVNNTSVKIEEYQFGFDLPNKAPLTLTEPLKFFVSLPSAVLAAIDEWNESKKTWLITGRVYVFGKFKKSLFSFKRCIPIEINITIPNPLVVPPLTELQLRAATLKSLKHCQLNFSRKGMSQVRMDSTTFRDSVINYLWLDPNHFFPSIESRPHHLRISTRSVQISFNLTIPNHSIRKTLP